MRAVFIATILLGTMAASCPAVAEPIHSSVNIDVRPDHLSDAVKVLQGYLRDAKRDSDLTDIRLDQQIGLPNHFILSQSTADQAAYDRHVQADYVRKFRDQLYPHLGSPWDERLFHDFPQ